MYSDDDSEDFVSRDELNADLDVTIDYDFPDATALISIEVQPHNGMAYDLPHMTLVEGLREVITTYCQLHHYYREPGTLVSEIDPPVGAVQYYVELAYAITLTEALEEDRAQVDFTRRVLLLEKLVDSLKKVAKRNVVVSQALSCAQSALQMAAEFDLESSEEYLKDLRLRLPLDYVRYLPTDEEEQHGEWEERLAKLNEDCLDYPFFIFVDDVQSAEEFEAADNLDDKNRLIVSKGEWPLTWDDVRPRRRIFLHTA